MGYPIDKATLQAEQDRLVAEAQSSEEKQKNMHNFIGGANANKKIAQTKDEQDALLEKAMKNSSSLDQKAVVEAGYVDFAKSVDDQGHLDEMAEDDVRK